MPDPCRPLISYYSTNIVMIQLVTPVIILFLLNVDTTFDSQNLYLSEYPDLNINIQILEDFSLRLFCIMFNNF